MKQQLTKVGLLAGSALAAAVLGACGGGGGSSGSTTTPTVTSSTGTVAVALTDAPACGFDSVNVTVTKVMVNKSDTASDTDASWLSLPLSPARKINLLSLTNGVVDTLATGSLDAGHYGQVRLVLDANSSGTANTVVRTGSTGELALDTPSGVTSGIKINGGFDVTAGATTNLVIDFDACKSVVSKGNGSYALKPVLTLVPAANNGISGVIAAAALTHHVMIAAEQNGQIIASTTPDVQTGVFVVSHLTAGNYDLVITSDNSAASVISAVPVAATGNTSVSTAAAPIALAQSATGSVSGSVTLNPVSATATPFVTAKQTLASGPVAIKYQGVDLTNAYTLANLPLAAPQYAAYSTTLPLAFNAASGVTPGVYSLEASATGYTTKSVAAVDLSKGNQTGVNFTLTP
ncbi:DUF4382 domain-containing protein [Massilia terrae]|uniref:DUF4382 domain-containing protein n=1 Tax=Massilia terrae TaxID=1811224 RepID=A0ABT2D0V0_9BURK|nr:DUF4382 domain-containing protein [Massilia terrae]MCS0659665.1 DUF4382 domain-containing protein [Massilia terrae]